MIFLGNLRSDECIRDCFKDLKTLVMGEIEGNYKPLNIHESEYDQYDRLYSAELRRINNK